METETQTPGTPAPDTRPPEERDDDREDVEANPEPGDVDEPTPAHPDTTPDTQESGSSAA
jgi:hypothetical protein